MGIINSSSGTDMVETPGYSLKIGTITVPAAVLLNQISLPYECVFSTGLTIVTSGTDDLTVIYK